jgi:uncharacterized protein YbjQ (UPF0145 family)
VIAFIFATAKFRYVTAGLKGPAFYLGLSSAGAQRQNGVSADAGISAKRSITNQNLNQEMQMKGMFSKGMFTVVMAATAFALAQPAAARDDRITFPLAEAMSTPEAQGKLDGSVKFYFSGQPTPSAQQTYGTFTSNKKTNAFNKSDKEACEWAFLSAMIALQDRAKREGGNAVVDIHSVYRNNEFKSATEYECGAGKVMAGVALRGTVVKQ